MLRVVIHTAKHLVPNTSTSKAEPTNSSSTADPAAAAAAAKVSRYDQIAAKFAAAKGGNKKPGTIATFCELRFNHQVWHVKVFDDVVGEYHLKLAAKCLVALLIYSKRVGSALCDDWSVPTYNVLHDAA